MSAGAPPLPTFLIIGAQKSATRWLRLNLGAHPDVYAARNEVEFFNNSERFESLGVGWYREQFAGWTGQAYVGEATPGYMFWGHHPDVLADRIEQVVPEARLLAILRNPVDRAYSAMVHHIEFKTLPGDADLVALVSGTDPATDALGLVSGGWYGASLEPFADRFGDQLLVLLHDDTEDDPRGCYDRALRHIGAAPDFLPAQLDRVRFSNQEGSSESDRQRQRGLTFEQRRALYEYFADDVKKLEDLFGLDLASWDPNRAK